MRKISSLQKSLLDLLAKNIDDPLTVREIQDKMGFSSTSVVMHHIRQLEKKGFLRRDQNNPRNYEVITKGEQPIVYLNLYGLAQCGPNGSILDGNPIDRIPVSTRLLDFPSKEGFMVKAIGNSMEPRIYEGDYIIAKRTGIVMADAIVVCVNNEEALIKKIRHKNNQIILASLHPEYEPIVAADDFKIEGEVRGVISNRVR